MSSSFLDCMKFTEINVETGAPGVGYTGKFFLPCKTHDIIKSKKSHVIMVASLEIPNRTGLVCLIWHTSTKYCIQYIQ